MSARGAARGLAVSAGAVLALALLLELVFRFAVGPVEEGNVTPVPSALLKKSELPGLRYVLRPGASATHEFGSDPRGVFDAGATLTYHVNALGLRGPEATREKPAGVWRIAALGDSVLFGTGVRDGETLCVVLQRLLTEQGRRAEVLNFGVPTYDTFEESVLFRREVLDFQPDVAFFLFFLNDTNAAGGVAFEAFNDVGEKTALRRFSALVDHVAARAARRAAVAQLVQDYRRGFEPDAPGWIRAQEGLMKAKEAAEKRGIPLVLVLFPLLYRLDERHPFVEIHERVAARARELGYLVLDLLPAFLGQDAPSLWVHPTNQHPNELGHELAARAVERFLLEHDLAGPRSP